MIALRFRDLSDHQFWRADLAHGEAPAAGCGPLMGRYLFNIAAGGPGQGLHPLRGSDVFEDAADDEC